MRRPPLLLAEASARDPFHLEHGFGAAYDRASEIGKWAWHDVFAKSAGIVRPRTGQRVGYASSA